MKCSTANPTTIVMLPNVLFITFSKKNSNRANVVKKKQLAKLVVAVGWLGSEIYWSTVGVDVS